LTKLSIKFTDVLPHISLYPGGRCGHDSMVVGFTTTYAISAYHGLSIATNVASLNPDQGGMYNINM
jgi:hypothetical protein